MRTPLSLFALSVHERLIWVDETAVAVRLLGAAGPGAGVGVGVGGGRLVNKEKSKRFGDPVPGLVTLLGVEFVTIAAVTAAGNEPGFVSRKSAATPQTCGDAIDVPEMVFVAVSFVFHEEVMLEPGAKMSTQVPKLENEERASVMVVAPTVMAFGARAGD